MDRPDTVIPDRPPDVTLYIGVDCAGSLHSSYTGPASKGEHGSDFAAGALGVFTTPGRTSLGARNYFDCRIGLNTAKRTFIVISSLS